jgi:hypothetical protein
MTFVCVALFAAGYIASIYTWSKARALVNGAEHEAARLRAKADALSAAVEKI